MISSSFGLPVHNSVVFHMVFGGVDIQDWVLIWMKQIRWASLVYNPQTTESDLSSCLCNTFHQQTNEITNYPHLLSVKNLPFFRVFKQRQTVPSKTNVKAIFIQDTGEVNALI